MIFNQIASGGGGSGGLDTFDATAYPEHLMEGYTAYARGMKITGTYKPPSSEIDTNIFYNVLIVADTGTDRDTSVTIGVLASLGHSAERVFIDDFISSSFDVTGYDLALITNCTDVSGNTFRSIYESCPNVLFGYFRGVSASSPIANIGIASSNTTHSSGRDSHVVPLEHPITEPIVKDISISMMASSNFSMHVSGLRVGTPLAARDVNGSEITLVAVEAGSTSLDAIHFAKRTCLYGWTHGRGGYTIVNQQILDRAIRWIIQGNL